MAIWDKKDPKDVEALTAKKAAEKVCGEPLLISGTKGRLRAEVWLAVSPQKKETFYSS
jgi:hypothetical protein